MPPPRTVATNAGTPADLGPGDAGCSCELPDAVKRKATVPKTTGDARLLALVFRVQDARDALS